MASIDPGQEQQVTFLSGVDAGGLLAGVSYWTWDGDQPATYDGAFNGSAKFGPGIAGTGATISYGFDPASGWSDGERAAFAAAAALWSAVADIRFEPVDGGGAQVVLARTDNDSASGGQSRFLPGRTGTATVGRATAGRIEIDTGVAGFGPLGAALTEYGGYPYLTLLHEWGHVLGLGHGGPYEDSLDLGAVRYTDYDTLAWTVMSYNDPSAATFGWGFSRSSNGLSYGNVPVTPMPLDIVAIQRLYGEPRDTPLSGGQIYGFNSNIGGEIGRFFDFTINSRPIVTLWNKGTGNVLDLSGFASASRVDLHDGSFSSVGGLTNNLAIAYGTRIDSVITGPGNDSVIANDNANVVMGGSGADTIIGGASHDHLYGAAAVAVAGDGGDRIEGRAGNDYIQGNGGDDTLDGGEGSDRIQGGQGNDRIIGGNGHDSVNGNLGNDLIDGGAGNDSLRGGQGDDSVSGGDGDDRLLGDFGADTLVGGRGADLLTGGPDADLFLFETGDAGAIDTITDFTDGVDRIALPIGRPTTILRGEAADFAAAYGMAQQWLDTAGQTALAVFRVGSDSFLFYDQGPVSPVEVIALQALDPAAIGPDDFA